MRADDPDLSRIVREGLDKAYKDFTARIEELGFRRTRKTFWTRLRPHTADFIYLRRSGSSYGAPINASVEIIVSCGIRVLNDPDDATALNGPQSDPTRTRSGRYHLRFNAKSGSTYERCIDDLQRFVFEQCEPFFQRFAKPEDSLLLPDSPLTATTRELLESALSGQPNASSEAASLKLLGIKKR